MALTIGRALPNRHQLLVERNGLVYWLIREVRVMSDLQVAYIVRLNGNGKGSIEYLIPEEIEREVSK